MPDSNNYIDVATSSFAIGQPPQILHTSGIGSCMVICLYDTISKTGALGHIMLPHQHENDNEPLRYLDSALPIILSKFVHKQNLVATLVGGANMFPDLWSGEKSVGNQNILTIKKILKELNIPIVKEDTGGNSGKSLEFELEHGIVNVYDKNTSSRR